MSDTNQPNTDQPSTPSEENATNQQQQQQQQPQQQQQQDNKKKPRTGPKRRKVTHGRPCQRCIKRSIGHLCHDEVKTPSNNSTPIQQQLSNNNSARSDLQTNLSSSNYASLSNMAQANMLGSGNSNLGGLPLQFYGQMGAGQLTFASEQMGNEISVISDFLDSLGDTATPIATETTAPNTTTVNNTERFFLTAADPSDGKLEDRLTEVINAKYEAGFLKPYNYVNGYARLQKYMDSNMSASSRQRILNVMGTFRPAFRSVAQSLTDIDLILVEEAFERLLLDYDRVFSSMGIPACLWRRTGEIYKGNKEFAALVNVPIENLREGRLCIYELMAEESAVNYWEKYGNIAFDPGQKAVLTSCLLRSPDPENTSVISCCFSFTIRRDKYNIPTVIVGNFLPIQLQ
ncbi:hypothetical protein G6F43_004496 [Rhizopus delemar]|nr:hypothetical protein G6F43_004496 [Rhizopus delemar]